MHHLKRDGSLCPAYLAEHYRIVDGELTHRKGARRNKIAGHLNNQTHERHVNIKGKNHNVKDIKAQMKIVASLSSKR